MNLYNGQKFDSDMQCYLASYRNILENMICGMTKAKLINSISHNFITQMIPHHKAAIEMSKNLLLYSNYIPLQEIALNIIKEQTKSIHDMENIFCTCSRVCNPCEDLSAFQQQMDRIMQTMFHAMKHAVPDPNVNITFMREMIPHHEGAISMAKITLKYRICEGLAPILNAIITSQEQGVAEMKLLLKQLEC